MKSGKYAFFVSNLIALVHANFVINTWSGVFEDATLAGYNKLVNGGSALDAVETGCITCENEQCDTSVGFGNHPDSNGHTSLDAMIMNGDNFDIGSVAYIRKYRNVISIARSVMTYTTHSMLVGDGAEEFANMMGFEAHSATTNNSRDIYKSWVNDNCQPNFYQNIELAKTQCGPYPSPYSINPHNSTLTYQHSAASSATSKDSTNTPLKTLKTPPPREVKNWVIPGENHDTIGMVVIDSTRSMACGTSTNGANHKVAGRVGDSPIPGAGCYVNSQVGGAAATGDGDIMLRFLPSFYAVMLMEQGKTPAEACRLSIDRIAQSGGNFSGGIVCVNNEGVHSGAANNMSFAYSYMKDGDTSVQVVKVA